jgi:hypothetical protein
LNPGSGAGRYVRSGSNPLGGAKGAAGQPGGVVGSVTPGGSRGIRSIEPQRVVNPQTFRKGQQLFQKVQGGAYPKSPTAAKIRQQAQQAGFKPGQSNIPASQVPRMQSGGINRPVSAISKAIRKNPVVAGASVGAGVAVGNEILKSRPAKSQVDPKYLDKNGKLDMNKMDDLFKNNPKEFMKQMQLHMDRPQTPTVLPDIAPALSNVDSKKVDTLLAKNKKSTRGTSNDANIRRQLVILVRKMDSSDPRYVEVLDAIAGHASSNFGRSTGGEGMPFGEEVEYLLEETDNTDKVIEKLMKNPKFEKLLPKLINHIEDEIELGVTYQMIFDEDGNFAEPPKAPKVKTKSKDVKESHTLWNKLNGYRGS